MASATFKPAENKGKEFMDKGRDAMDKGKEAIDKGKDALEKVKDVGNDAYGKAKDVVGSVGEMAANTATTAGERANDFTAAAGHQLRAAGDALAHKGPHDGFAGQASQAVAGTIQEAGRYIEDAKLSGMANDLGEVIKNHPIPTMLVCFGIGFCVGRAMKD